MVLRKHWFHMAIFCAGQVLGGILLFWVVEVSFFMVLYVVMPFCISMIFQKWFSLLLCFDLYMYSQFTYDMKWFSANISKITKPTVLQLCRSYCYGNSEIWIESQF